MEPNEKRKLKAELEQKLNNLLCGEDCYDDEMYFLNLIYAQEIIARQLVRFDDIFEGDD